MAPAHWPQKEKPMDEKMKEINNIIQRLNAYMAASGREDFLALDIRDGRYLLSLLSEKETEIKKLKKAITIFEGVLNDYHKCRMFHEKEYTELWVKFHQTVSEKETEIEKLKKGSTTS
jgi:hypothetical protein